MIKDNILLSVNGNAIGMKFHLNKFTLSRRQRKDCKKGSTLRALVRTFWGEFLIAGLCKFIADGSNYSGELD